METVQTTESFDFITLPPTFVLFLSGKVCIDKGNIVDLLLRWLDNSADMTERSQTSNHQSFFVKQHLRSKYSLRPAMDTNISPSTHFWHGELEEQFSILYMQ